MGQTLLGVRLGILASLHNLKIVCKKLIVRLPCTIGNNQVSAILLKLMPWTQNTCFACLCVKVGIEAVQQGLPLVLEEPCAR